MTKTDETICPIPQPPLKYMGLLGNLPDIDLAHIPESFAGLAEIYGEIYQLQLGSGRTIVLATQALCNEASDETRFYKAIANTNQQLRNLMGDGIFTSHTRDESWKRAHRILMPLFGPLSIKGMLPQMIDVASQLILKWDRFGYRTVFDCVEDFTKLTLDTIALIGFDYRFNSLYTEGLHPFVSAMMFSQVESGRRANRLSIETRLRIFSQAKYFEKIKIMHDICDEIVQERKENPQDTSDLLNAMLNGRDPETGDKLSEENIRYQMVTFLIAGHETTSGLLGFCLYMLLKNPEKMAKARAEVDELVGDGPVQLKHLSALKYLEAVIRETLRLYPTAPGWSVHCHQDTTLMGGKYLVKSTDRILMSLPRIHRDPKVYGNDAEDFRPERMMNGQYEKLPPGSYKPFGNGARACIGRGFALQEATLVLILILQRFEIELADPNYQLEILSTLTIKPKGLRIRVKRRRGKSVWVGLSMSADATKNVPEGSFTIPEETGLPAFQIYYGSNQGTCRSLAETIHTHSTRHGFKSSLRKLDDAVETLKLDEPVLFITPSYEGQPPDNAKKFMPWLKTLSSAEGGGKWNGLRYAVLGVGSSDWATTFHRVPRLLSDYLNALKADPIVDLGLIDTTQDMMTEFEDWTDAFWRGLGGNVSQATQSTIPPLTISTNKTYRSERLVEDPTGMGMVLTNQEIVPPIIGPSKRHVEIQLDPGVYFRAGDYLSVLPMNNSKVVQRVLARFAIPEDAVIELTGPPKAFLPMSQPIAVRDLLEAYVELATTVTKKQLAVLSEATRDPVQAATIESLRTLDFEREVLRKRSSIIDILERFSSCDISFAEYVDMLQPLRPRQYSISSAPTPTAQPMLAQVCSITFDVFKGPAYSGTSQFYGVASNYLADLCPSSRIHCSVRPTQLNFCLPPNATTPVIMIAAGTGIAPMRAFVQERQHLAQKFNENKGGPVILYYGCRDADVDYLFRAELEEAERQGVMQVRPSFSQSSEKSNGFRYVYERIWNDRNEVFKLIESGAKILLCGSAARLSRSTNETLVKILREKKGLSEEEGQAWLQRLKEDQYATDVFG
ncbi:hypothetical protein NM208_g5131 [Fusarium decemcellulare]|uniref:Uncharacterized protein n=1 Tax=Fusarium decemcellulare TaxID=57161 RepID=A0ACC1SI79_9HYPO|nr:hypothetical protein NM208_g5131 [Fusarium decemcellulare]